MIVCIHGRSAADPLGTAECLDCEELAALLALETSVRNANIATSAQHPRCREYEWHSDALYVLDAIRRRKGIGALGHPETRP